jgi:pentafunctional AROM polypeptide
MGNVDPLKFYLLGTPISHSRSPALHNTLFKEVGLPHQYLLHESQDAQSAITVTKDADFGGASITIPHKETVIPFLDELTAEATAMAAVNTIVPVIKNGRRHLIGDNTDWIGIQSSFPARNPRAKAVPGLIIGNGGTAKSAVFTLDRMGISPIYVACRSPSKLQAMSRYGIVFISSVEEAKKITEGPAYAVSTIPGNVPTDPTLVEVVKTMLSIPSTTIDRQFLEMAYLPRETAMMKLAKSLHWVTIPGAVPLTLQGLRQFELWTGLKVPTSLGARAVDGDTNGVASV